MCSVKEIFPEAFPYLPQLSLHLNKRGVSYLSTKRSFCKSAPCSPRHATNEQKEPDLTVGTTGCPPRGRAVETSASSLQNVMPKCKVQLSKKRGLGAKRRWPAKRKMASLTESQ